MNDQEDFHGNRLTENQLNELFGDSDAGDFHRYDIWYMDLKITIFFHNS